MYPPVHNPWYRDGLVWSVFGFILFGFLIGLIVGQFWEFA